MAAYDKRQAHDPDMEDAIALLRKWDGQMDKDAAAPLIADLLFHYVRTAAAERASPGNGAPYDIQISSAVVETLLAPASGRVVSRLRRNADARLRGCVGRGPANAGQGCEEVAVGKLSERQHRESRSASRPLCRKVFRHRGDAHERRGNDGEADDAASLRLRCA